MSQNTSPVMFIGIDVSDKKSHFFFLHANGEQAGRGDYATTERGIEKALAKRPRPARVVLEAGTHSPWMSRLIARLGFEVVVADPRRLRLISQSTTKNDRNDAEVLARLGRADLKLLRPIHHRSEATQTDLAGLKIRTSLVESRTGFINTVRGLCKSAGLRLRKCEAERFHVIAREGLPPSLLAEVEPALQMVESLTKSIAEADKRLEQLSARYPDARHLAKVYGVGPVTSLTYVLTLEDKTRFAKSRSVGQYVGLCPRQDQSGDTDKQLRISKAGDRELRRLLVQCAQTILREGAPDSDLKRWGQKLASRGGKTAKRRAVVAVARKLSVLLHRLWVTGEDYQPLYKERTKAA